MTTANNIYQKCWQKPAGELARQLQYAQHLTQKMPSGKTLYIFNDGSQIAVDGTHAQYSCLKWRK